MKNSGYERISALDALRGMAVLLMLEQHLGFWLWDMGGNSTQIEGLLIDHPIMVGINGLGGLAAPIFITLAGVGSILLQSRHGHGPILLIKRGIVMLLFGYILNLLGRDWFTVGSWYVLHLIGISLIIAPLLHRLKTPVLAVLLLVTLLVAVGLQDYLKTPLLMDDRFMTDYDRAGGIIRLSLAEGHFPIFPWIFLFITGIIAGRWINARKLRNCILLGLSFLVIASAMLSFHYFTPAPAVVGPYSRALLPSLTFYPAMPIMVLMLASAVLFILVIFVIFDDSMAGKMWTPLVCLGRSSLSLLIAHIAVLSALSRPLGFWKSLGVIETGAVTVTILVLVSILAVLWRKAGYRYGAEWLLRKMTD